MVVMTNEEKKLAYELMLAQAKVLFANEEITKLLQIPEGFRTVSAIAVGTSADALQERTLGTDKISTTTL